MKKVPAIIIALLISVSCVHAQSVEKAKEILKEVSAKYKKYSSIKADFKFTLQMQGSDFKEEQKGTLYMKKEKFKLLLGPQEIMTDGKTLWVFQKPPINEVNITDYDPKVLGINPSEMFTMYDKGYLSAYMGEEKDGSRTLQIIELTPENKNQNIFKVKLYVDKATKNIVKSTMYEKSGNLYIYEITNFAPNTAMTDNTFTFSPESHSGVKVIDLRDRKK